MLTILPLRTADAEVAGLGDLPGGDIWSSAIAISADGSVVVGQSSSIRGSEAFIWTAHKGMIGLGDFGGGSFFSKATAVSANGSVVVGEGNSANRGEAFRWTAGEGMIALSSLGGDNFNSKATGVSANGSVVVGYYGENFLSPWEAFRWTADDGIVGLGRLAGSPGGSASFAYDISADGSVVVGFSGSANGFEAFRWTETEGMVGLGDLPGGIFNSSAYGVSADGTVVVGESRSSNGHEAFRWTQTEGMVGLGYLPGAYYVYSKANDVTSDGSIIVGDSNSQSGTKAFRWTQETGMQTVEEWLAEYGVDTNGLQLVTANGISDNDVIVGIATNSSGYGEAYLARVGGLLFFSDYLSSFKQINNTRLLSQRISQQVIPHQPFDTLRHRSKLLKKRSEQQPILYASNTITPEMYIDQGRDLSQDEWTMYPIITYSKWGDDSLQRAGVGVVYSTPSWYVNLEPSTSKADTEADESGHQDIDGIHLALSGGLSVGGVFNTPSLDNLLLSAGIATSKQDAEINRRYLNGASAVVSKGDPNIEAVSYFGKAGWLFPLTEQFSIMPYVSALYSVVDMDDYTETGGSFPGDISTDTSRNLETRLGLRLGWSVSNSLQVSGWATWVDLDEKSDNETIITPMGLGAMSATEEDFDNNWYEAGVRANRQVADNVGINTTVSGAGGSDYPADFSVNLALTVGF